MLHASSHVGVTSSVADFARKKLFADTAFIEVTFIVYCPLLVICGR